jgi:hypothetical protein
MQEKQNVSSNTVSTTDPEEPENLGFIIRRDGDTPHFPRENALP